MAAKLIPIQVGGVEIEVEAVPASGTETTSNKLSRSAGGVLDAFSRAQETIIAIAKATADMIDMAGREARPDGVEVEFGLKFSLSGGVIMAGASGAAALKVTLTYDAAARRAARLPASELPENMPSPKEVPTTSAASS